MREIDEWMRRELSLWYQETDKSERESRPLRHFKKELIDKNKNEGKALL